MTKEAVRVFCLMLQRNYTLRRSGDRLCWEPPDTLEPQLLAQLKAHKAGLLAIHDSLHCRKRVELFEGGARVVAQDRTPARVIYELCKQEERRG